MSILDGYFWRACSLEVCEVADEITQAEEYDDTAAN